MSNQTNLKKFVYQIQGMHCANCEIVLERRLKEAGNVVKAKLNHLSGRAKLLCSAEPSLSELKELAQAEGYVIIAQERFDRPARNQLQATKASHLKTGAIFLIVAAIFFLLKKFNLAPEIGISENMSYGFVFIIGLVAAVSSCLAVTGGLILALAAKNQANHPEQTGWQKFRPFWHFNLGRLAGYAVLGGLVGALGSVLSLSVAASQIITVIASLAMIILGVNLLELFPKVGFLHPRLPKFLTHKIHDLQEHDRPWAPFTLGGLTFFLPCGFTAALQLYVLSQGGLLTGALTMFIFALGTLPSLLSVSVLSSFIKGPARQYFIKFAGVLVILIGLVNFNQVAAVFSSSEIAKASNKNQPAQNNKTSNVEVIGNRQIAKMKIVGYEYLPSRFTINPDLPVEWRIDASRAAGCAQVLVAPALRLREILPKSGIKKITFTPGALKKISFSCAMGMTTPGAAFIIN